MDIIKESNINNNKYSIQTGGMIISLIISIFVHVIIYNWLININKCKCSQLQSYNKYLSYISIILIINVILCLISFIVYDANENNYPILLKIFFSMMSVLTIIYYIFLYKYIISLKKIKCDCGNLIIENFIYYYLMIIFAIFISLIILLFLTLFFSSSVSTI